MPNIFDQFDKAEPQQGGNVFDQFHAPDGSAASSAAGPGWEVEFPRWASWRAKIGESEWSLWFAKSRPNGSEASLVADSPFTASRIREKYEDALTVHFHETVAIHDPR